MRIHVEGFAGRVLDPYICYMSAGADALASATIGDDSLVNPAASPVVDTVPLISADLPGQLDSIPGGAATPGSVYTGDPAGVNVIYTHAPAANPTQPGQSGYMQVLAAIAAAAATGMTTFAKGSPTPGIPAPRKPVSGVSAAFSTPSGGTNWAMVAGVVLVGVVGVVIVVKLL